eukprot:1128314-Pyramimonas_sp.AAC.2
MSSVAPLLGDDLKKSAKAESTKSKDDEHGHEFKRSLSFWKLCALTFASVAGGESPRGAHTHPHPHRVPESKLRLTNSITTARPYGFEETVGAGGPYLT